MYDKTPQRRNLGLQLRKIVQKSFSGDRYLREHEQMLWLGKYRNEAQRERLARNNRETLIDMLDNVFAGQEYRPGFLRHLSGFSAFDSPMGSARYASTISVPTTEAQSLRYPSGTFSREEETEKLFF
jgi:hypothetical protein